MSKITLDLTLCIIYTINRKQLTKGLKMTVTKDLSKFGLREKAMAKDLLSAYGTSNDKTQHLGDGVEVWFNTHSACVFLSDEDFNTAMINGNNGNILEDFFSCPNCGEEGLSSDFKGENTSECCQEYANEMGL
jgi:hypothetical protein